MNTRKNMNMSQAVISAEEILREEKPCTPERIASIRTGQLALNDMTASRVKKILDKRFLEAIERCEENDEGECKL